MTDYTEIFEKAGEMMDKARKLYGEGNITGGNKAREEANRMYESAERYANSDDGKLTALYGENRNFGIVMRVLRENVSNGNIGDKHIRKLIRESLGAIKSDPALKAEAAMYMALTESSDVKDSAAYVERALSLTDGFRARELREANERLIRILQENRADEYVNIPDRDIEMYDIIESAMLTRKDPSRINEYIEDRGKLAEALITDDEENGLTDDEEKLIEDVLGDGGNTEEIYNGTKEEALESVKRVSEQSGQDAETRDKLNSIYEDIISKEFRPGFDALKDIAEFVEIKNVIDGQ